MINHLHQVIRDKLASIGVTPNEIEIRQNESQFGETLNMELPNTNEYTMIMGVTGLGEADSEKVFFSATSGVHTYNTIDMPLMRGQVVAHSQLSGKVQYITISTP